MGSSKKIFTPPPSNPNAGGAGASKSTYNIPVVSNYDSNNYQPFFTQQAVNPMSGLNPSFFNTYGSVGQDPAQVPYNPLSNNSSNAASQFALSAGRSSGVGFYGF